MRFPKFGTCCLALLFFFNLQSLVDLAREEAERRRLLEQQGIKGKVIENNVVDSASNGNGSGATRSSALPEITAARSDSPKSRPSVSRYRSALQKLDRDIQQSEDRLASRQARLQAEKRAHPKTGRSSGRSRTKSSGSQLQAEIEELQIKLKRLREERFEAYESGKKAGFLPGELDGKYSNP
jgi:hypothetical protein